MAELFTHVFNNLPEYLCKTWIGLIGCAAFFVGLVLIGRAIGEFFIGKIDKQ